jgi:hypothetical protein
MKYTPGTPGSGSALPDGEYPFEVTNAEEKVSNSSGNDMIELVLKIKGGGTVYDYLVDIPDSHWKLDNFLASIGYDFKPGVSLDINPDNFIGRSGTCLLYTDTYQGKQKNKVGDYIVAIRRPRAAAAPPPVPTAPGKDNWR